MTRSLLTVAICLAALTATGCLRSITTVTVHKNGTATIVDSVLYSPRFLGMMESFSKQGEQTKAETDEQASTEPFKVWNDSTIRADGESFGSGTTLDAWTDVEVDRMRGYVATYTVSSINGLLIDSDRGMAKVNSTKPGAGTDPNEEVDRSAPWRFEQKKNVLTISNVGFDTPQPKSAKDDEGPTTDEELYKQLDMMAGFLRGMVIDVSVVFEAPIIGSTASHMNGGKMTLIHMDFDQLIDAWEDDPEKFRQFDQMKEGNTNSMYELMDQYPPGSMLIEVQDKVMITF